MDATSLDDQHSETAAKADYDEQIVENGHTIPQKHLSIDPIYWKTVLASAGMKNNNKDDDNNDIDRMVFHADDMM